MLFEKIFVKIFAKMCAAITAGILFSVVMSAIDYTPPSERMEGVYYYSFPALVAGGILYTVPLFLFPGLPISVLLDNGLSKFRTRHRAGNYLLSVVFYALGGAVVAMLLLIVIRGGRANSVSAFLEVLGSAVLAAMLFLHLSLFLEWLMRKAGK
jgi:hypothetical protein